MSAPNLPDVARAILVDAAGAARLLSISERAFHALRGRPDFPPDATVILAPRMVRFRVAVLEDWCATLAAGSAFVRQAEPERLRRGREKWTTGSRAARRAPGAQP